MRIIRLIYTILILFLALYLISCGGLSMIAMVVEKNGTGISDVSIEVKTKSGKPVAKRQTDTKGVFRVDGLSKKETYTVSLNKETVIPDEKTYSMNTMQKKDLKNLKIQLVEVAGIKGKIMGIAEQKKEPATDTAKEVKPQETKKEIKTVSVQGAAVYLIIRWLNSERTLEQFTAQTNPDGYFEVPRITKDGEYRLSIYEKNYEVKSWPAEGYRKLKVGAIWDIGEIVLEPISSEDTEIGGPTIVLPPPAGPEPIHE